MSGIRVKSVQSQFAAATGIVARGSKGLAQLTICITWRQQPDVFGEELCRVMGWSWVQLSFEDGFEGLAVAEPGYGLAMLPIHFIYGLLEDPDQDNTIGMLFQMICRSETPEVSDGDWRILG